VYWFESSDESVKQIYALLGGEPRKIVYVGCANDAVERVKSHWSQRNSIGRQPVKDWLCTLAEPPAYHVFEDVPDELGHAAEQYYTEIMRQINPDLLNVLDGRKMLAVTRERISLGQVGKVVSDEARENVRKSRLGKRNSEEANRKLSETQRLLADVKKYICKRCGAGPFTHGEITGHGKKCKKDMGL
jgi:hypothetical protein